MKQALTIAGSDSGGGAGIQADIKTMMAHGVYAASVVTAVTAQNTTGVRETQAVSPDLVRSQMEAVFDDLDIAAIKTGMLHSAPVVEIVADMLEANRCGRLVVDPVLASQGGVKLLEDGAIQVLIRRLFPLARLITPNLPEASLISGVTIQSIKDMHEAAKRMQEQGPRAVVVKGGHAGFSRGTDVLLDGDESFEFNAETVFDGNVHGTGCTFSAAVTARLALGEDLPAAVETAKAYTARVIAHAPNVGKGDNPGNHFYFIEPAGLFKDRLS